MVKVQKSQHVNVGALIVWDRGIRKVFKAEHHTVSITNPDGSTSEETYEPFNFWKRRDGNSRLDAS